MGAALSLLVAFGAGIASFFSPCILPLIPAYLAFITGLSITDLRDSQVRVKNLRKIFYQALLFILGFSFIFVSLGASATYLGSLVSVHRQILRIIGGALIILFGLYLTGIFKIKLLPGKKILRPATRPATILGSFLVGGLFALSWTPCAGPILASILTYAAIQKTLSQGILLLSIYSIGLGIPFLLTALAVNTSITFLRKIKKYFKAISVVSGLLLITVGLFIIFQEGITQKISSEPRSLEKGRSESLKHIPRRVSMEIILTEDNFQKEVLESELPVLVDFWAEWCAPCRMVGPIVEEIAQEYSGRLRVGKLNVDENQNLAAKYGIRGIPTLLIFKEGKVIEQIVGALPKEALKSKIDMALAK